MAVNGGHFNPPCDSSATVPVFTDHDAILANLSVTVLFREVQTQVPGTVGIGGDVLPRSGGADHGEASGVVHVFSMAPIQGFCKGGCATFSTGTPGELTESQEYAAQCSHELQQLDSLL